jgi:peptidoglycan/LPS O-acetylase OafA/YrhL
LSRIDSVKDVTSHINGYNHLIDTGTSEIVSIKSPQYSRQALIDTTPRTLFLAEFSALKSLRRIFTMKQKNDNDSYPFINGVRVLSLMWVIIGHSLLFGIAFTSNTIDILVWSRNVAFQLISSAVFSVDTFFFLSGFLTAILFIRQVKKEDKLSFRTMILYYIHRYIRLTPTFLLVVAISINLTPYFGSGPIYPTQEGFESPQCRSQYWWTSILYVGNLVKPDNMCLTIAWYLHNDMQFHWIAPLALIPFALGRKSIGIFVSILLILVGIGSTAGLLIYYPDLQASENAPGADPVSSFFDIQ